MNIQQSIDQEKKRYSRRYLQDIVEQIFLEKLFENETIAFYGAGEHRVFFEYLVPSYIDIKSIYCIDQEENKDVNHIFPWQLCDFAIDTVVIASYTYRTDMKYVLEKNGYKGTVIDVYDELYKRGICLNMPVFSYSGEVVAPRNYYRKTKKSVEFYLSDAFEIKHFLPLYQRMLECGIDAKFIAEPNEINVCGKWFDWENAIALLEKGGYQYDVICDSSVDVAFTTQRANVLSKYYGKKYRLSYGFTLNQSDRLFQNSDLSTWGFDCILVHGELPEQWTKHILQKNQRLLKVGYPKYIDYFNQTGCSRRQVAERIGVNCNKSILLCLPTWGSGTAIERFASEISRLRSQYTVVTKMHHCTMRLEEEKRRRAILEDMSDVVLDRNYEMEDVIRAADVVITDALSGASTEAPFLNKDSKMIYIYGGSKDEFNLTCMKEIYGLGKVVFGGDDLQQVLNNYSIDVTNREKVLDAIYGERGCDKIDELIEVL